jgi:phosphatidylethanolamine-binding protein (PEBP) family uncharacterized protein
MNRLSTNDWRFASGAPGNQWWHYVLVAIPHRVRIVDLLAQDHSLSHS